MRRTNFFCPRCFVFRIYPLYLFPKIWFRRPLSEARMKREPGAIPGQSRCCEAPQHSEHLSHWPRAGKASEQEPVRRPAKSIRHRTRPWDGRSISEVFHQDEELTRRCAPFRPADALQAYVSPVAAPARGCRRPDRRSDRGPGWRSGRRPDRRSGRDYIRQTAHRRQRRIAREGVHRREETRNRGAPPQKGHRTGSCPDRHKASEAARAPCTARVPSRHKPPERHGSRLGTSSRRGKGSVQRIPSVTAGAPCTAQAPGAVRAPCPWKTSGRTPGSASGNRSQRSYPSHP